MLMVAVIAHAIIRYRLMDIKVVIQRSVVYVCAILASALVFVLASEVLKRSARTSVTASQYPKRCW